jgi:hypothetical protein
VLEKHSRKAVAAIALAALALTTFQLGSAPAYSEELDRFGVEKLYPTADGGNEWYVDMDDPRSDPDLRNLDNVQFSRNADGSWRVSADQIRMEAWSPANEKWRNVEITEYAKIEGGSNELLQLYSRGGHHTSRDECLGSAYKARLYGNGEAAWNKEITHPAYAGNRAETRATTEPLEDRWVGFKAVIYNFEENGNTYVRLESYIDDDVTGTDGNLVVGNDWQLASVYEDRGDWSTNNDDFDSSCGRDRDEILTQPGGTETQNIAAFRSDDLTWSFKYLSVREIDPTAEHPAEEEPLVEEPVEENPEAPQEPSNGGMCDSDYCIIVASQHVQNDGSIAAVNSVDLSLMKNTSRAHGVVTVAIVTGEVVLATDAISTVDIKQRLNPVTAQFDQAAAVEGNSFDVVVMYAGSGLVEGSIMATN